MTAQEARREIITWRRQLEKLNQPIDAEAWDMAITALDTPTVDATTLDTTGDTTGDCISRQWCLSEYDKRHQGAPGGARKIIEEATAVSIVTSEDTISRQAAIDALYKMLHDCFWADDEELDAVITTLNELPSAQPEDCDTCKHGYFGNSQCENCRVRYPSHYERRTDEQTND